MGRRRIGVATFLMLTTSGAVLGPVGARAASAGTPKVVEATGVDLGRLMATPDRLTYLRVPVEVPEGASAEEVTRRALWSRGAVPLQRLDTKPSPPARLPATPGPPVARFDPSDSTFSATPWPSDRFRAADGSVDFSSSFPNPGRNGFLHPYLTYGNGAIDGFSRNGAIFFGLTAPIDEVTLPSAAEAMNDPAAGAQLVDVTDGSADYGRRIPLDFRQQQAGDDPYLPGDTLMMRPVNGFPLADDHTYCALLTRRLADGDGRPLQRDTAFSRALVEDRALAPLFSWLRKGSGVPAGEIAVATCFTTQKATDQLHRIESFLSGRATTGLYGIEVGEPNPAFLEVLARYRAPNFQSGARPYPTTGGDFVFDAGGQPVVQDEEELRVRLVVPRNQAMPATGWPVVLYSHGTGGDWSTCLEVAGDLVGRGLAMICIDQPFHGARGAGIDPAAVTFNILNPAAGRTNFRQGALDVSWLTRMVADGRFNLSASDTGPDGAVRLDPGTIVQFGHSQGAITGAIALGVEPQLGGGVLSASGGVFADVGLLQRPDQELLRFVLGIILGIPPGHLDAFHPVTTLFQTVWDAADPVNYAPYWTQPVSGGRGKDVLMTAGTEDPFSPVDATNAVAAAGGVPLLEPVAFPSPAHELRGVTPQPLPVSGNVATGSGGSTTAGLRQVLGGDHFVAFQDKETRALWRGFVHSLATSDPPVLGAMPPAPPGDPPPPPPNDDFAAAVANAVPFVTLQTTRSAGLEPDEPRPCGEVGASVWHQITPIDDVHVRLETFGSDFDTVLAVYTGDTVDNLAPVACNDDAASGLTSAVVFEATAGVTYRIQAGGFQGEQGTLVLRGERLLLPPPPPPPPPSPSPGNDLLADAVLIEALPFGDAQSTDGAGVEPGEPQPCGQIGATVWYRFAPEGSTMLRVDTEGSDFDTVLAVYTGGAVDDLTVVGCNDDTDGTVQSRIVYEPTPGTTYWIQAGGFDGQAGELFINVDTAPGPPPGGTG